MKEIDLDERSRIVLNAVVAYYIAMADPVGSRTLWKTYKLDFSPATVRNIMADLEEMGLLQHPHTSAGRVPTEKGYRFYVDFLRQQRGWEKAKIADLAKSCSNINEKMENLFSSISHLLSVNSQYIGVVLAPRLQDVFFKHVKFIRIRDRQCLVIFITNTGTVHERLIDVEESYSQDTLDKMARCLDEYMQGQTLSQARETLLRKMAEEKDLYSRLLNDALKLSRKVLDSSEEGDVYIDGKLNILNQPEFSDVNKMKDIFKTFEEKNNIIHILDKCMSLGGMRILIGSENETDEMKDCSLVTAPYKDRGRVIGTLGVIGPTRMQ